jgi:hypothetical protein
MSLLILKDKKTLEIFNQVLCDDAKQNQKRLSDSGVTSHNSCAFCAVCFQGPSIDDDTKTVESFIKHHITYFPQKIAYVHDKCHKLIHDLQNPLPWFIQYQEGDSRKFYDLKQKMTRKNIGVAVA